MVVLLLFLFITPIFCQNPAVINNINWESFLSRHDPIWKFSVSSYQGYTILNNTIKHSAIGCPSITCVSQETCPEESASICDACPSCTSFGLSPYWNNGVVPQFYSNDTDYITNTQWTTYAKGGTALSNHSGCISINSPQAWEDGPFYGNGLIGGLITSLIYGNLNHCSDLKISLGRIDVWDHRVDNNSYATGQVLFDKPRLPIGYLLFKPAGSILNVSIRIHLYNSSISGTIITTNGQINFISYVHALYEGIVTQINVTQGESPVAISGTVEDYPTNIYNESLSAGGLNIILTAQRGNATRETPPSNYIGNPIPTCSSTVSSGYPVWCCTQLLYDKSNYASAITISNPNKDNLNYVMVSTVANDWPKGTSDQTAIYDVTKILSLVENDWNGVFQTHANWWAKWYPASFLSIPNTTLEGMYWIQQYKLSSATRFSPSGDGIAIDLIGPWFVPTSWPMWWFDLNVQLTYWPTYTSSRFDIAQTLVDYITLGLQNGNLVKNAEKYSSNGAAINVASPYDVQSATAPPGIVGDLPWIAHNLYMHARQAANDTLMKNIVYPLLRLTINFYIDISIDNSTDGYIHLQNTTSPEYPDGTGPDCNYDLALFKWGCITLLQLNSQYNLNDPLSSTWSDIIKRLVPFPTNENGLMVTATVPFNTSHRHFSHLFAIYPLHLITWDSKDGGTNESRELIQKSLDWWIQLTCTNGPEHLCPNGFTFDGASSISALFTDSNVRREAAIKNLTGFIDSGQVHASTMYSEGHNPCIESPLAAMNSLQEILLTSWGNRIRVFPSVPTSWSDVVFANFSAEGGFNVSAVRSNGTTQWIAITSLSGLFIDHEVRSRGIRSVSSTTLSESSQFASPQNVTLSTDIPLPYALLPSNTAYTILSNGDLQITLQPFISVFIYSKNNIPSNFIIEPLKGDSNEYNYWGKR